MIKLDPLIKEAIFNTLRDTANASVEAVCSMKTMDTQALSSELLDMCVNKAVELIHQIESQAMQQDPPQFTPDEL